MLSTRGEAKLNLNDLFTAGFSTYPTDDGGLRKNEELLRNQLGGNLANKLRRNNIQIAHSAKARIRQDVVHQMF